MKDYCALLDLLNWNIAALRTAEIPFVEYERNLAYLMSLRIVKPF